MTLETHVIPQILPGQLTPLVRQLLDDPAAELLDADCHPLSGGYEQASTLYLLEGKALQLGAITPWRVVLKIIRHLPEYGDLQQAVCWQREILAYQSGVLENLPGGMAAPRCYAVEEHPDAGETWMWLEFVTDDYSGDWQLEQYGTAAYRLGAFNAAYAAGRALPTQDFAHPGWLRRYVEEAAANIEYIRSSPRDSIVQRIYGRLGRALLLAFWDERARLLALLDAMPQTFCHQDAYKNNLFLRGGQLVAVDWSYPGRAPLGAEIVPLVLASLGLSGFPVAQAVALDQTIFDNYLRGLADSGCPADSKQVRLAFCILAVLRYIIGANVGQMFTWLMDQEQRRITMEKSGVSDQQMVQSSVDVSGEYYRLIQELFRRMGLGLSVRIAARAAVHYLTRR